MTNIRSKLIEVLDNTGEYRMGWIPAHRKAVVNAILTLLRGEITKIAQEGEKDPQDLKGALLYSRLLALLK